MPETDDPSSPEILGPSGITQRNAIVALRARSPRRRFQVSGTRDITAETDNVMVRDLDTNDVVIVDYGLSFNEEDEDGENLTRTGEQLRNRHPAREVLQHVAHGNPHAADARLAAPLAWLDGNDVRKVHI